MNLATSLQLESCLTSSSVKRLEKRCTYVTSLTMGQALLSDTYSAPWSQKCYFPHPCIEPFESSQDHTLQSMHKIKSDLGTFAKWIEFSSELRVCNCVGVIKYGTSTNNNMTAWSHGWSW